MNGGQAVSRAKQALHMPHCAMDSTTTDLDEHAARLDGAFIRRARTELVERPDFAGPGLARRLADQMDGWFAALGATLPPDWSLVATGGYAAGFLCPGSDVDVTLLHPNKARSEDVQAVAEGIWYPLWDASIKLSPSTHSVSSMLALASGDLRTATSILRLRLLAGEPADLIDLRTRARDDWQRRSKHWLSMLRAATDERWQRHGPVAALLEPDLKDGFGGLRDHDAVRWAMLTRRMEVETALDVPIEELASSAEHLLAVRCELHRLTSKTSNVLLLQDQDALADAMGYADADVLMSRLSAAAHAIEWSAERFWWRIERTLGRRAAPRPVDLARGIRLVDGEVDLQLASADIDQSLTFRVADAAARSDAPISRRTLLTLAGAPTSEGEQWSQLTRHAFVSLLGSGPQLVQAVDALERYELFSRLLPEWRHVRSRPQRNAFHKYTVDRHLLQTVVNAGEFVRSVARPDLLLVGALLHDVGKGREEDHTALGVRLVDTICPRMGFDPDDVAVIRALVDHHLLLSETATRRDLSDPRTAENVAALVGDALVLELLNALTVADSKATGSSAWSTWKASLVAELVDSVERQLAGKPRRVQTSMLAGGVQGLVDAVRGDGGLHFHHDRDGSFDVWTVATVDRHGLFARIAGALAVHGVQVVSADVSTSFDGIAVDQFRLIGPNGVPIDLSKVERDLRGMLVGSVDLAEKLAQRIRVYGRSSRRVSAAAPPRLEVHISNDESASTTVVDVRAPDGVAVLHRLAAALAARDLEIRSAKVATLGHEVVDVFYVQRSPDGVGSMQVPDHEHDALRDHLCAALADH